METLCFFLKIMLKLFQGLHGGFHVILAPAAARTYSGLFALMGPSDVIR